MEYNVGDHFTVTLNGKAYDTVIDEHGVQRYVGNPIVAAFVEASGEAYDKWCRENPLATRNWDEAPFTLNNVYLNNYTLDQLIEFNALHGYSVGGMCDLSFMDDVVIVNPLWED